MKDTNGNGTYTTYNYDADGDLLTLINYAPNGSINSSFIYTYNSLGLETGETTLQGTWTYAYDADGELIHAVFASNNTAVVPDQDLAYSYDALGNRTTTVINGITTTCVTNNMNQYTSVGGVAYKYDANGNLLYDGTNTYSYNSLNELTSVSGPGGTTTYAYNALGQLVSSTTGGQTTQYLIDPAGLGNVVGTYTGSGSLIADYTYGLGLVSQVTAGGTYYYNFDALGSTVGLSNSSGTYVNTYSYLPFGGLLSSTISTANPFQFVGQLGVAARAMGLDNMRLREYSSGVGRFTQEDPIGIAGGVNSYAYALNAPTVLVDPSGLCSNSLPKLGENIGIGIGRDIYIGLGTAVAGGILIEAGLPIWGTAVIVGGIGWAAWSAFNTAIDVFGTAGHIMGHASEMMQSNLGRWYIRS